MDNFIIFKNLKKVEGSKQPDFRITTKVGDKWEEWGSGWSKESPKGKYISCSKSKPFVPKVEAKVEYPENQLGEPIF